MLVNEEETGPSLPSLNKDETGPSASMPHTERGRDRPEGPAGPVAPQPRPPPLRHNPATIPPLPRHHTVVHMVSRQRGRGSSEAKTRHASRCAQTRKRRRGIKEARTGKRGRDLHCSWCRSRGGSRGVGEIGPGGGGRGRSRGVGKVGGVGLAHVVRGQNEAGEAHGADGVHDIPRQVAHDRRQPPLWGAHLRIPVIASESFRVIALSVKEVGGG